MAYIKSVQTRVKAGAHRDKSGRSIISLREYSRITAQRKGASKGESREKTIKEIANLWGPVRIDVLSQRGIEWLSLLKSDTLIVHVYSSTRVTEIMRRYTTGISVPCHCVVSDLDRDQQEKLFSGLVASKYPTGNQ